MASKNTGQILKPILSLIVAILLTHVHEVETSVFPESSISLQFSHKDEPHHHIRQRRAESITYTAEIEINASNTFVINEVKNYLKNLIANTSIIHNVALLELNFTTVCNKGTTGTYQCECEDQYFWPCDKCTEHGSCKSIINKTCSCINAKPEGKFCQPKSEMTDSTVCKSKVIGMSVEINETFDTSLINHTEVQYRKKAKQIELAIDAGYKNVPNYIVGSAAVTGFRSGSIIADYTIEAINTPNFTLANVSGINLVPNAFSVTEKQNLYNDTAAIYPQQKVNLKCPQSVVGPITWKVNDVAVNNAKYSINESTLIVNSASERDSGRYSCTIQSNSIPYVQWQDIKIQQQPSINVGEGERIFLCDGKPVRLTCCVNGEYSIQWVLNGNVMVQGESGENCITVNHTFQSGNCRDETFICRLKDLPQLLNYNYSNRTVTVRTSAETADFTCQSDILGMGKLNSVTKGPCKRGEEGSITYKCASSGWIVVQNDCVLEVIKRLENEAQVLIVEQIPQFVKNLTNEVQLHTKEISESPLNIQTIVEILAKIANISENITIHKPVIEDFLKTVDIIISNETKQTWEQMNNGSVPDNNTSIELLQAIETISSRLSDDNFNIKTSSIQLNRNVIDDSSKSLNVTSQLENSTTNIFIPNVPKLTSITIIFFTNLGNVLPTRISSNNDSGKSNNSINGDVVVVKVNKTINNISSTFDLKNTSLGNPQCVYWNFSLNHWDSSGCKVKLSENDLVTCECDHTTSFSILMSPFAPDLPALAYITYIGVAISMASLVLCLIIEMIVWKSVTRNDTSYMRHVSIVNMAVSLLIANICFIIAAAIAEQQQPTSVERCSPAVFFMHFFYLALFFWMFISALLLLYRTVMVLSQMSKTNMMVIAFTVGYIAPLLIAVITVASTAGPKNYVSKKDACWLNWFQSKALLAFVIPALTIVFFNLLVLIVVVCKMLRRGVGATTQPDERHTLMVIVRCVAFLTPIFGLTWGFGIGTMVSRKTGIHVVFAILNSLQGFFVLVFGILLDGKVREALAGKLSLKNLTSNPTGTTNAGTSSSVLGFFEKLRRRNVYNMSNPSAATSSSSSGAFESLMNT